MKRIAAESSIIALVAALSAAPVFGQTKDAKPQVARPAPPMSAEKSPAIKDEAKPAATRKRGRSLAAVDARHCLKLATNMAIHQCAEKYRPH
jgi:hypothetical protein